MDQAKHTPGPWETSSNGTQWDVCGPGGGDMIADVQQCSEAEANAKLIAAAPALLAALQMVEEHGYLTVQQAIVVRAAIAQARGQ
jgi:hypothetical protein